MFKPYGLTYTLVWFVILSKIPSGNELKGLSNMVLKIKYLLITQENDLIDIVKAPDISGQK